MALEVKRSRQVHSVDLQAVDPLQPLPMS